MSMMRVPEAFTYSLFTSGIDTSERFAQILRIAKIRNRLVGDAIEFSVPARSRYQLSKLIDNQFPKDLLDHCFVSRPTGGRKPSPADIFGLTTLRQFCRVLKSLDVTELITRHRFISFAQAIYSLETGEIFGEEFLLRSKKDLGDQRDPMTLFQDAADGGVQGMLDEHSLELHLAKAKALGQVSGRLAFLNIRTDTLLSQGFTDRFRKMLRQSNLHPNQVVLEVREDDLFKEIHRAVIQDLDVKFAYDDIGRERDRNLDVHIFHPAFIKLDRDVMNDIAAKPHRWDMVRSYVRNAHNAGALVVAEGVGNVADLKWAMAEGIDLAQAFILRMPLPTREESRSKLIEELLAN